VYSGVALAAVVLLILRRYLSIFGKAELGGPTIPRVLCSLVFLGLWLIYIALSGLETYKVIKYPHKPLNTLCSGIAAG